MAAAIARDALDARSRGLLSRHRLSAARRRHHLLPGLADLRHRAVGHRARRTGRLAALDRDPDRLLRRADRAAPVHADRKLACDDRARRQPVVCIPDADHALAAIDAGYRADDLAIRRHIPSRRADVTDRLGDADPRQSGSVCRGGSYLGRRAAMHQPFAETGAGQRRGAVSIFDDRVGGDLRFCGVGRRAVDLDPDRRGDHHRRRFLHLPARADNSGAKKRWSIRRRKQFLSSLRTQGPIPRALSCEHEW